jgi:hypothetical protein
MVTKIEPLTPQMSKKPMIHNATQQMPNIFGPVIWMDGICLSTMMAEYYAPPHMREVIPLRELIKGVTSQGFDKHLVTTF